MEIKESKVNPQAEDGHVDIANEIVEAFAKNFPGFGEAQVLWSILRKTYGWHKKSDLISISQIQKLTGLSRRRIIVCLKNLEAKKMIVIKRQKKDGLNLPNEISFQKHYNLWVVTEKSQYYAKDLQARKERYRKRVVTEMNGSDGNVKRVVTEMKNDVMVPSPTKETITKESNTKERIYMQKIKFNSQTKKFENITQEDLKKWKESFPDIETELKKMEIWLDANPNKLKENYKKFIFNWLSNQKGGRYGKNKGSNERYVGITADTEEERFKGEPDSAKAGEW